MLESPASSDLPPALPALRRWLAAALVGYWCLIFAMTHIPIAAEPLPGESDKLVHLMMYGGLSFLLAWHMRLRGWSGFRLALLVLPVAAIYGLLDEALQIPVGRHADAADWLADCAGAVVGLAGYAVSRTFALRWLANAERAAD